MINNSFYKNIMFWDEIFEFNLEKIKNRKEKVDVTSSYNLSFSTIGNIKELDNYQPRTINKEGVGKKWELKNYAYGLPN